MIAEVLKLAVLIQLPLCTYTYIIVIFGVDIGSFFNMIFHLVHITLHGSYVQRISLKINKKEISIIVVIQVRGRLVWLKSCSCTSLLEKVSNHWIASVIRHSNAERTLCKHSAIQLQWRYAVPGVLNTLLSVQPKSDKMTVQEKAILG